MYAALGLGTIALIAAISLYFAGQLLWAGAALVLSVVFDVLFALAIRDYAAMRGKQR
jgi:hypothetical protein